MALDFNNLQPNQDSIASKVNASNLVGYIPPTSDYQLSPNAQEQLRLYSEQSNQAPAIDPNQISNYQQMSLNRPSTSGVVNDMPVYVNQGFLMPANIMEARKSALQQQAQEQLKKQEQFAGLMKSPIINNPFIQQNFKKDWVNANNQFMQEAQNKYGTNWREALTTLDSNVPGSLANRYINFVGNAETMAGQYNDVINTAASTEKMIEKGDATLSKEDYEKWREFRAGLNDVASGKLGTSSANLAQLNEYFKAKLGPIQAFNNYKLSNAFKPTVRQTIDNYSKRLSGTQYGIQYKTVQELEDAVVNDITASVINNTPNWQGNPEELKTLIKSSVQREYKDEIKNTWDAYHAPTGSENKPPSNYQGITKVTNRSMPSFNKDTGIKTDKVEDVYNVTSVSDLGAGGVGNKMIVRPPTVYDSKGELVRNNGNMTIEPIEVYERSYVDPNSSQRVYVPFLNAQYDSPIVNPETGETKYEKVQVQIPLDESLRKQLSLNSKVFDYASKTNPDLYKTRADQNTNQSFVVDGVTYNIPTDRVEAFKKAKGLQ